MKKRNIVGLVTGFLFITGVKAQNIQEGINFLYAEKDQSAKALFEKILATNPNNIEATYWLGQAYIAMNNVPAAKQLYDKALMASANAPLVMVGSGEVDLFDNKISDARQKFEAAITMTHTRKGDDPTVLNAVGRANIEAKNGDLSYAIQKLEAAVQRDPKSADIFLNLGNAYRKASPGEGGQAYINYKKALEVNPNFAPAYYRLAKIFETQMNWDLFLENLNDAVTKDPTFAPAYYDLYYYYLLKRDFATADDYAKKYIANADPDVQNDYLRAQTLWAQKKYDEAIDVTKAIISKAGDQTQPRTYKLLAYCYVEKGDTLDAKTYIDEYFAKAKPEEIVIPDIILKANIYSGIPGNIDAMISAIMDAVKADTIVQQKVDLLYKAAKLLKDKGERLKEADFREMIYKTKPYPSNIDLFDWGLADYFGKNYVKADSIFGIYAEKYPDQVFGPLWRGRCNARIDTAMEQGLAVPFYQKVVDFTSVDSIKYKAQFLEATRYLAGYYNNIMKDRDKTLEYVNRYLGVDSTDSLFQGIKKALEQKPKQNKQNNQRENSREKPTGKINKEMKLTDVTGYA